MELDLTGSSLLDRPELRPAERKVAEALVADPGWFSRATLAEIAARAAVSEPTVLRFTRSLGARGFQDFRYALIQQLAGSVTSVHARVAESDTPAQVVAKTIDSSVAVLSGLRASVSAEAVESAAVAITQATDMIVLGFGASGIVGQDIAQKFPLFGLPIHAPADAHQQFMATTLAGPSTVVMAVSNTGETAEVLHSAREAHDRGATVVALTGRDGPLARLADIVLLAPGDEDTDEYTPTTSRLAQLAVVDALAIVVALRRGPDATRPVRRMKRRLRDLRTSGPAAASSTM